MRLTSVWHPMGYKDGQKYGQSPDLKIPPMVEAFPGVLLVVLDCPKGKFKSGDFAGQSRHGDVLNVHHANQSHLQPCEHENCRPGIPGWECSPSSIVVQQLNVGTSTD